MRQDKNTWYASVTPQSSGNRQEETIDRTMHLTFKGATKAFTIPTRSRRRRQIKGVQSVEGATYRLWFSNSIHGIQLYEIQL
jgi:hypothetical protein